MSKRDLSGGSPLWRRALILSVLCALLAVLSVQAPLHEALLQLLAVVEQTIERHPLSGLVLFVLMAALSAMFAFVSTAILVPAAIFTWGEPLSILLLWIGWILGGVCTYGIGRYYGRAVVHWLTAEPALQRFEERMQRDASFGMVLLFQLALPSEIPGYAFGLVRYPFSRYLLALGLAEVPYTLATIYVGASVIEQRSSVIIAVGMALVTLSVSAVYLLHKRAAPAT
jgi:uncharacterized membrane protein YdjX (TVP38/TMEM64 family)